MNRVYKVDVTTTLLSGKRALSRMRFSVRSLNIKPTETVRFSDHREHTDPQRKNKHADPS